MTDGLLLPPGGGRRIQTMTLKAGAETYLQELTDLLAAGGPPDQAEIAALRRRHDIHQLTPLTSHPLGQ